MTEKTVTEREAVERERVAFCMGATCWIGVSRDRMVSTDVIVADANKKYPMAKVTRPRVVKDPDGAHYDFRAMDGHIECRDRRPGTDEDEWYHASQFSVSIRRATAWIDLLNNPSEEVDQ